LSSYEAIPAGTPIYVQVDAANANMTYGAVLEMHEIMGVAYNNIMGPVSSTTSQILPAIEHPISGNQTPNGLPPRR